MRDLHDGIMEEIIEPVKGKKAILAYGLMFLFAVGFWLLIYFEIKSLFQY